MTPANYLELLRASSAIPFVFDPVSYTDTITNETVYLVDGGALNNVPVSLARLGGATEIWTIMLGPRYAGAINNDNMLHIAGNLYSIMVQRILDDAMMIGVLMDEAPKARAQLAGGKSVQSHNGRGSLDRVMFAAQLPQVTMYVLDAVGLAGGGLDFNDQCSINTNYNAGYSSVMSGQDHYGFSPYVIPPFDCATPLSAAARVAEPCPPIQPLP